MAGLKRWPASAVDLKVPDSPVERFLERAEVSCLWGS